MKYASILLLVAIFGGSWHLGRTTCVLESEFGFSINCAFKKSGLFRIRNLGGLKAHASLGFTLGDELGFKESLSNVENNRRRSVQGTRLQALAAQAQQAKIGNAITVRAPPPSRLPQPEILPIKQEIRPGTVPPFKPIPPAAERPSVPVPATTKPVRSIVPAPALMGVAVPAFNKMPVSISRLSTGPTVTVDSKKPMFAVLMPAPEKLSSTNFALRTLPSPSNELSSAPAANSIQAIAAATNISIETIENAILMRQKQMAMATTTTTTTTTYRPPPVRYAPSAGKVMNAPKEYYPVGYDKNFDDNFASRVDLPETSFYCGDQKHFPGLYADEDLGCMVFHVCALTDDGLIMKSFLCPESTLFDQTILKCNWWFYVDCKSSKKLYDSNIPISKSYQLMKALTFFSTYKKDSQSKPKEKD